MGDLMIKGHTGIGPAVSGEALVADDNFSARYDLDRIKGVFSRPAHKLFGESYLDKVLVLNIAKGGVATAWMLHTMKASGLAPAALLLNWANPIIAQGAAFANFPLIDRFDGDITKLVSTGDQLRVNPATGTVTVEAKGG
jgi:predicted aconitase with swiveling domain